MAWVKLDDHFDEHPKLANLNDSAFSLWVSALAYCNRNLTDGFVPSRTAERLRGYSAESVDQLLTAGLWQPLDGGFSVHDYLDFQPRKSAVVAEREAARTRIAELRASRKAARLSGSAEHSVNIPRSSAEVQGPRSRSRTKDKSKASSLTSVEQAIYDRWREQFKKGDRRYDRVSPARLAKIRSRLREFSAPDVLRALDAAAHDPWEERMLHSDLTVLLRNREQVDRFLEMADAPRSNGRVKVTGWRMVRGSHGTSFVRDDAGTDRPPREYA